MPRSSGSPTPITDQESGGYDILVYGDTAAAVVAAVASAREGRSTLLVAPATRLGGMTSGGLGATDIGDGHGIGGIAAEFYRRVRAHYEREESWTHGSRAEYRSHRYDPGSELMFFFEPHVAEDILWSMLRESGAHVLVGERLVRPHGVLTVGTAITGVRLESGAVITGKVFIDASYEGDLMAGAGVSYAVGRESSDTYGEPHAGNQWRHMREREAPVGHDFFRAVDAYVRAGDRSSGLLPGVPRADAGEVGEGDECVQAYCYRMCLTDQPDNIAPIEQPDGYDPLDYEILLRHLTSRRPLPEWPDAGPVEHPTLGNNLMKQPPTVIMPNRKSDSNTKGAVSFNLVGGNYDYPEAGYADRDRIAAEHRRWQQGLMWFVANDPRVPPGYREPARRWGLAADEFPETGHWPHQLYVREARRMIGEFVMTEQACLSQEDVTDSVGVASYTIDSHNVRRYVDEHGLVRNEGTLGLFVPQAYPVAYGAITPLEHECVNLLVPVCLSASHVAYGSIRMEPVFMILAESAAAAAIASLEQGRSLQRIDRRQLREALLRRGQVLETPEGSADRPHRE